ncbi:hypothetical protein V2G26_021115 [Clonostachys chloroleuca]
MVDGLPWRMPVCLSYTARVMDSRYRESPSKSPFMASLVLATEIKCIFIREARERSRGYVKKPEQYSGCRRSDRE